MRSFLLFTLQLLLSLGAFAQVDLELSFSIDDPDPAIYTTFVAELTVHNAGDQALTDAEIGFVVPAGLIFVGQGAGFATQGNFLPYENRWEVGALAAGDSATLFMNFFNNTGTPKRLYAQVNSQSEADSDSTPGNGTAPIANEDDEADLIINDDGNTVCAIDFQIAATPCDDNGTVDPSDDTFDAVVSVLSASGGSVVLSYLGQQDTLAQGAQLNLTDLAISAGDFMMSGEILNDPNCALQRMVFAPAACSDTVSTSCAGNLLLNGDFEASTFFPSQWRVILFPIDISIEQEPVQGNVLLVGGENSTVLYQTIDAIANQPYMLTYSARSAGTNASNSATLQIKYLSASWQVLGREFTTLGAVGGSWEQYQLSGVSPADTRYIEVRIERPVGVGDYFLDDFCLTGAGVDPCANDSEPPRLGFCPQDRVITLSAGQTEVPVQWVSPIASDNCSSVADNLTATHLSGDSFGVGTTTVTYTVFDDAGNVNSCSFDITILPANSSSQDLVLDRILPIFVAQPGRQRSVRFTSTYVGSGSVPVALEAGAYLSLDPVLSADDVAIGSLSLGGVSAGTEDLGMDYTVPVNTRPGDYFILIKLDDSEVLAETNELNNVLSVAVVVSPDCFSRASFPWHEWIGLVELGELSNASGKSTYTNNSQLAWEQQPAETIDYRLEAHFSYVTSSPHYSVYLDSNQDQDLSPAELWFTAIGTEPPNGAGAISVATGQVDIPALPAGNYRVRVLMQRDSFVVNPCRNYEFGEVEDYLLTISPSARAALRIERARAAGMLLARPNPIRYGHVSLQAPSLAEQEVRVSLIDAYGRVQVSLERYHDPASSIEVDLPGNLPSGLYQAVVQPTRGQLLAVPVVLERD